MTINALELSKALIQCPSVTPEDGGSQRVLREALEAIGFTCHSMTFSDADTPDVKSICTHWQSVTKSMLCRPHGRRAGGRHGRLDRRTV